MSTTKADLAFLEGVGWKAEQISNCLRSPDIFGKNPCNRYSAVIASDVGVAAEAPKRVHLGKIGIVARVAARREYARKEMDRE